MQISTPRSGLLSSSLVIALVLYCCMPILAFPNNQSGKQKITIIANNATLNNVFRQIEKQTGMRFMYAIETLDVNERVNANFKDVLLDEVLDFLLGKKGITWQYREKTISLKKRTAINSINISPANMPETEPGITITGQVLDAKDNPVPGATVQIKGTKKGTKTDGDGNFVITGASSNVILVVSSIGFETREVFVRGKSIQIKMKEVISSLDEKVVVGYAITTPRYNIGSVTHIKGEAIANTPGSNPLLALQGRVPGMFITQTTGLSGGRVNVQIRGRTSINNGTQPLFIVDGVPYDPSLTAPLFGNYGALGDVISALNFINPSDIESIDVLKDADATAIYGSRGANGVVLITTKKGRIGDTKIDVNVNTGWQNVARRMSLLNTPEYLTMRREAFKNDGEEPTVDNAPDLLLWDTTRYTDWQKEMIGGTARYTDAQTSISGGTAIVQYLLGGNYHKETTIFPGDFYSQRGGTHFSLIGNSPDQRLRASLTGSYIISKTNFPGGDFADKMDLPPNAPPGYNPDGSLNWANSTWENPYAQLLSNVLDAQANNVVANIDISYRILTGLNFKVNIGYNELKNNTFSGYLVAGVPPAHQSFTTAFAQYNDNRTRAWISEPQLTYTTTLGKNVFNILVGSTLSGNKSEAQYVNVGGISQDALIRNPDAGTSYFVTGRGSNYKYMAFFGRLGYIGNDKYLMNLTIRRDGSSRFGPRNRFSTFGSIALGWIFSQEAWFHHTLPFMSFGKLRASYGITGNDQIGDYQYFNNYQFVEQPYQDAKGLRVIGLFNPDFSWERTRKAEIGLETGFLNDKILFNVNCYRTVSNNQLLFYPLPAITGGTKILGNQPVTVRNVGAEFVLTTQNVKSRHLEWQTAFNLFFVRNKLVSNNNGYYAGIPEGHSISERFLYSVIDVDPVTGKYRFADTEGKPVSYNMADSRSTTIDLAPVFSGGLQNSIRYKSFRLDILFQYVKQNGAKGLFGGTLPGTMFNQPKAVLSRWSKSGDIAEIQRYNQNNQLSSDYLNWLGSDRSYGDASFVRCKNIVLSWQFPDKLVKKVHLKNCRIYLQGQNLFIITNYPGWDPETQSVTSIPPLRVITAGINLTL